MNKNCYFAAIVVVFLAQSAVFSQTDPVPKFEVAAEFTTLERDSFFNGKRTEPGVGGRFTYNINRAVAVETAGYFFPKECFSCDQPGRVAQFLAGVKAGKRYEHWGVFAKARPGLVHFTSDFGGIVTCLSLICPFPIEPFRPQRTHFAADVGGVLEFYPSKRIVTRFDAGDTLIHFSRQTTDGLVFNPITQRFDPFLFDSPARTTHNFQFFASVGLRF